MNAKHGKIVEDLTGQKFGFLTVIRRGENRNGRSCWVCRCICGTEKVVTAHDLKAGKTKSCGCVKNIYLSEHNRVNLSGKRFGKIRAIYPTDKRDSKGSVYWHCICDCGREKDITASSLVHGNIKSCGCLRAERRKNIYKELHMVDGTCVEMLEKRKYRRDNKSGFRGVYQMKDGKYRVDIGFKGKRYYLGRYQHYNDAVQARIDAESIIYNGFLKAYREWELRNLEDPEWGEAHPFIFDVTQDAQRNLIITRNSMNQ